MRLAITYMLGLLLFACSPTSEEETNNNSTTKIEPEASINLPKDHYGHEGAPVEWWWHTGTLVTEDGRAFGFEINATGIEGSTSYAHSQIEITDTTNHKNYQNITAYIPQPEDWCAYDSEGSWFVKLSKEGSCTIEMTATENNPMQKHVYATFLNKFDGTLCSLDLELVQDGPPLLIWGNGVHTDVDPKGQSPITRNHYYYALTNISASGNVVIGADTFYVTGKTWTDHQYGALPKAFKWIHQNIQLDNGIQLSNYTNPGEKVALNTPISSKTSLLMEDGTTLFVDSKTTPMEPIFSLESTDYFMQFKIEIDTKEIKTELIVSSLLGNQVMADPSGKNIYEGVASTKGTFNDVEVKGTAWIEENLE